MDQSYPPRFFVMRAHCVASGCNEELPTQWPDLESHLQERRACGWRPTSTKPVRWYCPLHAHLAR